MSPNFCWVHVFKEKIRGICAQTIFKKNVFGFRVAGAIFTTSLAKDEDKQISIFFFLIGLARVLLVLARINKLLGAPSSVYGKMILELRRNVLEQ